jgi:hypothetical protein
MSSVVLRCPNCGTTQSSPGECEACHEGQVRYYCTNHTPGRWLDGSICPQCLAAYGRADPPAAPTPSSRPAPTAPPAARRSRAGTGASSSPRARSWDRLGPWGRRSPPPPSPERDYATEEAIARAKAIEKLHELFRRGYWDRRSVEVDGYSTAPQIGGGCLRFVVLVFLFLMLGLFGLSMLGDWLLFSY